MTTADWSWSATRLGDAHGPVLAVFIHGGFWRARYAADTIAPLSQACADEGPRPCVWNVEYPRLGMRGGGWPGTALAVAAAVGAAVAAGRPVLGRPSLLLHGDADDVVPIEQSRSFRAAALAVGDRCDLHELPGGDHFEVIDPGGRAWPILRARLQALAEVGV